jgi:hypothetical protein
LDGAFLEGEWGRGLLLEYVFTEVVTVLLKRRRDIGVAARVGRLLLDGDELDFVPCSDLFTDVLQIFTSQDVESTSTRRSWPVSRAARRARLSFADAAAVAHVAKEVSGGQVLTFRCGSRKISRDPGSVSPTTGPRSRYACVSFARRANPQ